MGLAAGAFDDVIKYIYEKHRDDWEDLGRPAGFFWAPNWRSYWSPTRQISASYLSMLMLSNTPEVTKRDEALLRRLRLFRALSITAMALMATWAALLFLLVDMA
jgi:hypothetical protein